MDANRQAVLVSFGAGCLALFLVWTYVRQADRAREKKFGDELEVIVAKQDINEMEQIRPDMVEAAVIPKLYAQPGVMMRTQMRDFSERTPLASVPLKKGEQITDTKIDWEGRRTGLSRNVGVGHRAISIPVNDQFGVGRLVKPGDRVDVLSPVRFSEGEVDRVEIKTVLQNVLVLATGDFISGDPPRQLTNDPITGRASARSLARDRNFNTVTLEVTPQQAQVVTFVSTQQGVLYLTLRNPNDQEELDANRLITTTQEDVLGGASQAVRDRRRSLASPPATGR